MKMEWKDCRRLVVSGLLLYLALHYWSVLADLAAICVGASAPLILGFVLAYMVNIPLTFFERKLKLEPVSYTHLCKSWNQQRNRT